MSVDPVTTNPNTGASFNRYAYAANSPYVFFDPDGRDDRIGRMFAHAFRNANQADVPVSQEEAKAANWVLQPASKSVFHQLGVNGESNTKWLSPDGRSEAVYSGDGELVTDELNGGTYNFSSPNDAGGAIIHLVVDVLPYIQQGNGPIVVNEDAITPQSQRKSGGGQRQGSEDGEAQEDPDKTRPKLPERPLIPSRH